MPKKVKFLAQKADPQGETLAELEANLREAIQGWLLAAEPEVGGKAMKPPSTVAIREWGMLPNRS